MRMGKMRLAMRGVQVSYLCRPYVEKSRRMLQRYVATALDTSEKVSIGVE